MDHLLSCLCEFYTEARALNTTYKALPFHSDFLHNTGNNQKTTSAQIMLWKTHFIMFSDCLWWPSPFQTTGLFEGNLSLGTLLGCMSSVMCINTQKKQKINSPVITQEAQPPVSVFIATSNGDRRIRLHWWIPN